VKYLVYKNQAGKFANNLITMDTINDMLTIIRNGYAVEKDQVELNYSTFKHQIVNILKKENYLESVNKKDNKLIIGLKYDQEGKSVINEIIPVSKPGRRIYLKSDQIRPYKPAAGSGKPIGLSIISTSQGIMTGLQAKKKNIGGQILFNIA
jgi:small subunit ribosomal protein S8